MTDSTTNPAAPACPVCGKPMNWEECLECDGTGVGAENGPDAYDPGDFDTCQVCHGERGYFVCAAGAAHILDATLTAARARA